MENSASNQTPELICDGVYYESNRRGHDRTSRFLVVYHNEAMNVLFVVKLTSRGGSLISIKAFLGPRVHEVRASVRRTAMVQSPADPAVRSLRDRARSSIERMFQDVHGTGG